MKEDGTELQTPFDQAKYHPGQQVQMFSKIEEDPNLPQSIHVQNSLKKLKALMDEEGQQNQENLENLQKIDQEITEPVEDRGG